MTLFNLPHSDETRLRYPGHAGKWLRVEKTRCTVAEIARIWIAATRTIPSVSTTATKIKISVRRFRKTRNGRQRTIGLAAGSSI